MSTTVKVQIQQRIDTASNWTTANPTLLAGEVGWESDTKKYKIGTGSTAWASLAYAPGSGGYTAGTGVSISASNVITASAVALTTVQTAANETAHLALTTQEGDIVVRSDENKSYVRNSGSAGSMADFTLLATPTDAVLSVNGNTGAITAAQLAAAIEAASDSNTFTDADHTKLNGISASANNYSISTDLLDEDNFATNSATKVASQQSIKAYVDANSSSVIDEDDFASNSATVAPSQQSVKAYVDTADALKANLSGATFTGDVVFTGDAANVTWDKSTDDLIFNDNAKAIFGTGNDFQIYHDGSHSYIKDAGTGTLRIETSEAGILSADGSETMAQFVQNGAVSLRYDNSTKLETDGNGINVIDDDSTVQISLTDSGGAAGHIYGKQSDSLISILVSNGEHAVNAYQNGAVELYYDNSKKFFTHSGGTEFNNDLDGGDNCKLRLGSHQDLQLYHDGLQSYIKETGTGNLYISASSKVQIDAANDDTMASFLENGAVNIHYDGSLKFATSSDGANFYGHVDIINTACHLNLMESGVTDSNHRLRQNAGNLYIQKLSDDKNTETNQIIVDGGGQVEIYHSGNKKLETTSSGITVTGSVTETSDISLKNDINTIQNPLELIEQIRGINFTWKNNGMKSMGVIAQDVEKVFPELVHGQEGSKTLQYSGLIGALVESVKELSAKVAALEAE